MEQGELDDSPDVVLLSEDSAASDEEPAVQSASPPRIEDEEELGPDIKPPQAKVKKDKHKHKHRREKKRPSDKERDRHATHGKQIDSHRSGRQKDERGKLGERDTKKVERVARDTRESRHPRDSREPEDYERRKKSMQERERLERMEKERVRLEKKRLRLEEERARQHQRLENSQKIDRQERAWEQERERERQKRADRQAARSEVNEPRRSKHDEEKGRRGRRARSPRPRDDTRHDHRRDRDEGSRQMERERRPRTGRDEPQYDDRRQEDRQYDERQYAERQYDDHQYDDRHYDDRHYDERQYDDRQYDDRQYDDRQYEDRQYEDRQYEERGAEEGAAERRGEEDEEEEDAGAAQEAEEESSSTDEQSEQEQSGSEGSESEWSGEEKSGSQQHRTHTDKVKSKFESESESEESDAQSEAPPSDDARYIEQTPPESPVELAPDLPPYLPAIQGCRNVEEFSCLNRIEEGTYGVVYRALDKKTDEVVALKRLKMEKEKEGFPITSLREINTLLKAQHPNIVTVREIVVGCNMDRIYIVMDYVEHDLKSLMEIMKEDFLLGEVKTLMVQLLRGVAHLHDNWIIHRDLKTSNLLFSHKGILKIGDFGLAREYGSPLKQYTPIVVTLWYRAPELLLACKKYSTAIDMWSVGCIMAEFLTRKPLFPGKSEIDELNRIFKDLGTPNEKIWPGVSELKGWQTVTFADYPYNNLRNRLGPNVSDKCFDVVNRFLTYDPARRITAEEALKHAWFNESPLAVDPSMFPTWPAKSEQTRRTTAGNSPKPPSGGKAYSKLLGEDDEGGFHLGGQARGANQGPGFALKF